MGTKNLRKSTLWSSYQPVIGLSGEHTFKAEILQFIRDIEDNSKSDAIAWEKYSTQYFTDEYKQKLREYKVGPSEMSLLHVAAKFCRKNFCSFLIQDVKLDKDIKCKNKSTPLLILVKSNVFFKQDQFNPALNDQKKSDFKETFDFLIEKNADINFQDEIGYSILHHAAAKNNYGAIYYILQKSGLNINIEDKKCLTPLHLACKYGYDEVAEAIIEKIEPERLVNPTHTIDFHKTLPLHLACQNKNEKNFIIKKILNKLRDAPSKANLLELALKKEDSSRQTVFLIAVENNHLNIVESLLKDYNVNKDQKNGHNGNMAIHYVAKNGSIEMFNLLQKYNAVSFKTNNNLENALHIAAYHNKHKFITEFLKYEHYLSRHRENQSGSMPCICLCDDDNYIPSIRQKDNKNFTPLFRAIAACNQKCVEALLSEDKNVELDAKDIHGNTIYHICTEFDNSESLKYLFKHYSTDIIFSKNNSEDSILHNVCRNGNLEMIKTILNKIEESDGLIEEFLFSKNKDGQTCFHIACVKGYCNIIEYFLKEKKFNAFLDHYDNNSNTSLHLATLNGNSSIVTVLLDHGADVKAKNEESITALDLSCRKGFFEISKNIINNFSAFSQNEKEFPLHMACYEGATEVVKLLLLKGIPIDQLNNDNQNCLDVAISMRQREVIRVLFSNENWSKLIRVNNKVDEDAEITVITQHNTHDNTYSDNEKSYSQNKLIENPQLVALFNSKMWDIFKIILDKCVSPTELDFTHIDPPVKSISSHTLMLIACSGQESLIQHEITKILTDLKWKLIPRFAFYFNLIIYMIFMLLFSLYTIELAEIGHKINSQDINSTFLSSLQIQKLKNENFERASLQLKRSFLFYLLIVVLIFQLVKELIQIFFLDGLSYFLTLQNLIELFTYTTAILSLFSSNFNSQSGYGSFAVLFAFICFPLFIQKLKMFGLYVVAFRRTIQNSAKFFPVFFIIFTGFILSFKMRSNFGVSYSNSTSYSIIRTLTMVVGELSTEKMGLQNEYSFTNFFIYILFIGLMCIILINLFVGIAVGEIKTVLDEADIQLTSMRIMFVLKVQAALYPFEKTFLKKFLNMNFKKYSLEEKNKFLKIRRKLWSKIKFLFTSSQEQAIKLSDPQKRLEDSFNEMARSTNDQIKSIRFGFSNQISDTESRLFNNQRRIIDSIIDLSNKNSERISELKNETQVSDQQLKAKINETQRQIEQAINKFSMRTNDEFKHTNKHFNLQMTDSEKRIISLNNKMQNILLNISKKSLFQFESLKHYWINQSKNIKSVILNSQKLVEDSFTDLERNNRLELDVIQKNLNSRIENIDSNLKKIEDHFCNLLNVLSNETSKSLKQVKENNDIQIEELKKILKHSINKADNFMNEIGSNIAFEFKSNKVSTNYLTLQLNNFELQLNKTIETVTKMNENLNDLNRKIEILSITPL